MKDFRELATEGNIVEDAFSKNMDAINKNMDAINKNIAKAIKNKDRKTLDNLTADLQKILDSLKTSVTEGSETGSKQ